MARTKRISAPAEILVILLLVILAVIGVYASYRAIDSSRELEVHQLATSVAQDLTSRAVSSQGEHPSVDAMLNTDSGAAVFTEIRQGRVEEFTLTYASGTVVVEMRGHQRTIDTTALVATVLDPDGD